MDTTTTTTSTATNESKIIKLFEELDSMDTETFIDAMKRTYENLDTIDLFFEHDNDPKYKNEIESEEQRLLRTEYEKEALRIDEEFKIEIDKIKQLCVTPPQKRVRLTVPGAPKRA